MVHLKTSENRSLISFFFFFVFRIVYHLEMAVVLANTKNTIAIWKMINKICDEQMMNKHSIHFKCTDIQVNYIFNQRIFINI